MNHIAIAVPLKIMRYFFFSALVHTHAHRRTHKHSSIHTQTYVHTSVRQRGTLLSSEAVGAVDYTERIVWAPLECAAYRHLLACPVAFGSFRYGGICVCLFVWARAWATHTEDEQLFLSTRFRGLPEVPQTPCTVQQKALFDGFFFLTEPTIANWVCFT